MNNEIFYAQCVVGVASEPSVCPIWSFLDPLDQSDERGTFL